MFPSSSFHGDSEMDRLFQLTPPLYSSALYFGSVSRKYSSARSQVKICETLREQRRRKVRASLVYMLHAVVTLPHAAVLTGGCVAGTLNVCFSLLCLWWFDASRS